MFGRIFRWGCSGDYAKGIEAYNSGRLDDALECFERVLSRHPDPSHPDVTLASFYRAEAHRRLAAVRLEAEDFQGALEHLDVAVVDQPTYPDLHLRRGVAQLEVGDALAAEESARRALERNAGFVEAGLLLVLSLDAQGAVGRREVERERWRERARAEGHPLAEIFEEESPPRRILRDHLQAVHRRRERVVMAESYERQGLHADARRLLEELVEENPHYPDLRVRLATTEFALGDAEAARHHVDEALQTNPHFDEARLLHIVLSVWSGEMAGQEEPLRELIDRPRVGPSARYVLAVLHLLTGRAGVARELLRGISTSGGVEYLEALSAAAEGMLGNRERCRELYEKLLRSGVSTEVALDGIAYAWKVQDLDLGRRGREFLPSTPPSVEVLIARACVHRMSGETEQAVDLIESATSENPRSGALLYALAELYMERGDPVAASRRYMSLVVAGKTLAEVRVRQSECLRLSDQAGEALRCLDDRVDTDIPASEESLERLYALRLLQRGAEAQELWEARTELLPLEFRWRVQSARRWLRPLARREGEGAESSSSPSGPEKALSREPVGP